MGDLAGWWCLPVLGYHLLEHPNDSPWFTAGRRGRGRCSTRNHPYRSQDALMRQPSDSQAPGSWIRGYYPAFDGLRAVAILMVFVNHYLKAAWPAHPVGGLWTGVDLFFVLSGFLITGILYDTERAKHYFRNFYVRRSLRILPVFYGFFLAVLLLTPVLHLKYSPYIWTNPLYVANLSIKGAILHVHGDPRFIFVPHLRGVITMGTLWSLCVEEQFYLLWPLVVWLVPSRVRLMQLCAGIVLLTLGVRTFLYFHDPAAAIKTSYLYTSTYTRCDTLLVGAWIALWLRGTTPSRETLRRIAYTSIGVSLGTIAALFAIFKSPWYVVSVDPVMLTVGYTLVAFAGGGILLRCLDDTSWVHRILLHPALKRLGTISYGFYFFHALPVAQFTLLAYHLRRYHLNGAILPLAFSYAYGMAALSFHYFESYFLRLKSVLAPGHKGIPRPDTANG
jgi:peptidoglycan/LPS O-acetylase OafA/YrhL